VKGHYFSQHAVALRAELGEAISRDQMRVFHQKSAFRHLAVAARQFAILALTTWGLIHFDNALIWIPLAFVQGLTVFNFTILLHEVVHHTIFERRRPVAERILGLLYATPSGISASQFTRWHLDHHAELGSDEDDPKRHHLSPKVNKRWYKLLYCTPALFPIYFRAARRESATYPAGLQQTIGWERKVSLAAHLTALGVLWYAFGFYAALRTSIIPVFFIFPMAFTLNRLGQHYDIDPDDPAKWGTLMKGHWFWDFAFLNSNYHLEHHYFPGVPFYRLPALQRALVSFYERKHMRWQSYGRLVYGWIVENHAPHTDWSRHETPESARESLIHHP
jgi:fatty acid desaturase